MADIANYGLIIAGLIPVIVSAIKVEKYYTNYYTGLWNIYGSILIILGFILDENVDQGFLGFGIFSIVLLSLVGFLSSRFNHPEFIRWVGQSTVQCSLDVFFIALFFSHKLYLAICLMIFSLLILYVSARVSTRKSLFISFCRKYRVDYSTSSKFVQKIKDESSYLFWPFFYFLIFILFAWAAHGYISIDFTVGFIIFVVLTTFSLYSLYDAWSLIQRLKKHNVIL